MASSILGSGKQDGSGKVGEWARWAGTWAHLQPKGTFSAAPTSDWLEREEAQADSPQNPVCNGNPEGPAQSPAATIGVRSLTFSQIPGSFRSSEAGSEASHNPEQEAKERERLWLWLPTDDK